jgi:hypothetical protein
MDAYFVLQENLEAARTKGKAGKTPCTHGFLTAGSWQGPPRPPTFLTTRWQEMMT